MEEELFYRFGKFIYKFRWLIILIWIVLLGISIPYIPKLLDPFKAIGFIDPKSQSAQADKLLNDKLGYSYNQFIILYHSNDLLNTDHKFQQEIKDSLADLKNFNIKHQIVYPNKNNKQLAKDKHTAYAVVLFKGGQEADKDLLKKFRSHLKQPANLSMQVGGEPIFLNDTKKQTQNDLYKADLVATPVTIIAMLIVFGSVVAALIPIVLGGVCAILILVILFFLGHALSLSVFTINIALLLGLCLSLDYSLLIISRFRDELEHGNSFAEAVAITQTTAGKAVFFSALAVFISLSALLLFPINVLFSVGVGGLAAVCVAMAIAIFLLPALLAVLNTRINSLTIRTIRHADYQRVSGWRWLVRHVINKAFLFFIIILLLLVFLGYPFLHVRFGISDFRILPSKLESREVFDMFTNKYGENRLAPILILVQTPDKKFLTKKNIGYLYDYVEHIKKDSRVERIQSIVNTEPRLTRSQYQMLYTAPAHFTEDIKKLLKITTKDNLTVVTITSKYPHNSPLTKDLIKKLRNTLPKDKLTIKVTGASVNTMDVLSSITKVFPYALLWINVFTYFILLILLRSVILPLKAIIMTMLSLCASYGVLVFVFQEGHLHHLLNFLPQGILDISLLIIVFCALFGISMDYEVFLLTRIKECYEQSGNTLESIEYGIDRSSRIITSAAIIVILLCLSFMFAHILLVKAFGLGIAVAVFVDAFLIRSLLVPATMALLGSWNWYLPKWLDHILPNIRFYHKNKNSTSC